MDDKLTDKQPAFYAIIPANVRYDKDLSPNAKLLYGEISALLNFNNKCFASNLYFSKLYGVGEVQISRLISQLIAKKHLVSEVEITAKGSRRLLKLALNIFDNPPLNINDKEGLNINDKHNSNSNNNKSLSSDKDFYCDFTFFDKEFKTVWDDYLKMRISIRKKATLQAERLALKEVSRLSNNDKLLAVKIVEQSILNSWQAIYPIKVDQQNQTLFTGETNQTQTRGAQL